MRYIEILRDSGFDCGTAQGKVIEYSFTFCGHKVTREVNLPS
jgi:hypothetical protein